jgi:hypothetical protein
VSTLLARLAALERHRPGFVIGIMCIRDGVESPVSVGGEQMSRAEFHRRYGDHPHRLRIYERRSAAGEPHPC